MNRVSEEEGRALQRDLLERVRALPGIESAALTGILPLAETGAGNWVVAPERTGGAHNEELVSANIVSPGFFETMGIPLVRGSDFSVTAGSFTTEPVPSQVGAFFLGGFGLLALLLASIDVYGATAYITARRTREIGIRIALGAQRHDILRTVLEQGMKTVAIGIVAGVLAAVTLLSSHLPARRAALLDPIAAQRDE